MFTASSSAFSLPTSTLTSSKPKSILVPIPLEVIILPSTTTLSVTSARVAPFNSLSKPGKQVALFPFRIPALPSMLGAAHIAATYLLLSANSFIFSISYLFSS